MEFEVQSSRFKVAWTEWLLRRIDRCRAQVPNLAVSMQLENGTALTLSLSPRRGNSLRPRWDESLDGEVIRSARERLPLPGGEGWGEGERLIRLNSYLGIIGDEV